MNHQRVDITLVGSCVLLAGGAVWLSATGCEQVTMILIAILLCFVTFIIGSVLVGWRRYTCRPVSIILLGPLLCLAAIISVAVTHWPLRVTYSLHRRAFDSLAQRVRAGEDVTSPRRVGVFTIRRAELYYNGIVCLWTDPQPAGNTGFVQCGRDHVPFSLWSIVRLDDGWQFISED